MNTQRVSLTLKILGLLLLPTILCLSGFGIASALDRRSEVLSEADRDLDDYVRVLEAALPPLAEHLDQTSLIAAIERMAQRQRVHGIALYDRTCHALARSEQFAASHAEVDAIACATRSKNGQLRGTVRATRADLLVHAEIVEGVSEVGIIVVGYELSEVREAVRSTTRRLALAGLILLGIMALIAAFLAQRFGGPLSALLAGVKAVAAGDLTIRIAERGALGTAQVAHGFNQMTTALARAQEQIERAEEQRHDLERRILHAQALAAVGQFAASLAHDIGSPLSTILMASRISSEDPSFSAEARKQFDLVATQCDRVTRIVKQLLSVARPARAERTNVDLRGVVNEVIAFVDREARARRVKIRAELPSEPVVIGAERDALLQMMVNLASNALQAQPEGGKLVFAVARTDRDAHIEVRDAGPGVPKEMRQRIFEPFFSTKPPEEGTGLGLSIAATVAKDLDGTIEVDDAPEGGACIRVTIPMGT
jgi:signal transduction histidine kinase